MGNADAHRPGLAGPDDASAILVYGLVPEADKGAIVHAPLPTAPQLSGVDAQQAPAPASRARPRANRPALRPVLQLAAGT
ncbi:hypothetical protein [Streptomyces sp. CB03911]|uniref:hypothetical protein n=1 Tax=Streptomyces sp. CB03911 TaxID=1804758 RepID=UPI000968CA77|nr:hypothetical protein [Streptomyces sp. CB03911]OKI20341.1 hypothetical protein A6A07_37030 [Streptomyces sp. CB03911]